MGGEEKRPGRDTALILIVEDNEDDVVLIETAFEEADLGNSYRIVRDGEEAMRYLRREAEHRGAPPPGLVLLDINMPKKNGFEVLREMKADPSLRHIPVIMLTTSNRESDIIWSYANGACSYITKPVRFDEFREVVKQFAAYWTRVARIPPALDTMGLH